MGKECDRVKKPLEEREECDECGRVLRLNETKCYTNDMCYCLKCAELLIYKGDL